MNRKSHFIKELINGVIVVVLTGLVVVVIPLLTYTPKMDTGDLSRYLMGMFLGYLIKVFDIIARSNDNEANK